ncbi:nuclear hormone receptor HR96 isoform X1 [Lingula anatina]|uniref:Nuclear hormone receptor HR96 isoform X1 n=2 Tax=Lingula anatina TaxID=7574 RepID=A0A1S3H4U9_LINAN|nr:nuclear hormone receptor HR96 isoform X1 [Lingula anatina]|eukprot:XP_013380491.1 nuclear hormone receptor HR96 isoform X1 [Lingula anatina]
MPDDVKIWKQGRKKWNRKRDCSRNSGNMIYHPYPFGSDHKFCKKKSNLNSSLHAGKAMDDLIPSDFHQGRTPLENGFQEPEIHALNLSSNSEESVKAGPMYIEEDSMSESQNQSIAFLPVQSDTMSSSGSTEDTEAAYKSGTKPKKVPSKICMVCGDKALGHNFGVVSCESCKAFFRRNAFKGEIKGRCNSDCEVTPESRSYCKHCRLRKCFKAGMKKDLIMTDHQKQIRRYKNRSVGEEDPKEVSDTMELTKSPSNPKVQTRFVGDTLTEEDHATLQQLDHACKISFDLHMENGIRQPTSQKEFINMADISVRRLIRMVKQLKAFIQITQEDQLALLKEAVVEMLVFRSCLTYDLATDSWNVPNSSGEKVKVKRPKMHGDMKENYIRYMHFVRSFMKLTGNDRNVNLIMMVLSLFSPDRPNIQDKSLISKEQEYFAMLLSRYLNTVFPGQLLFPKVMMKLTEVRDISVAQSKVILQMEASDLEPLLVEIFNL